MTRLEMDNAAVARACLNNKEAMSFLSFWGAYVHAIDDIIDGDKNTPEDILRAFSLAITLYSHPFYLKNIEALRQIAINATHAYADSVAWEHSKEDWQRSFSDHYRHFGQEMVFAVASICSYPNSYDHIRSLSLEWRTVCWMEHHKQDGTPS